ncbi:DUF2798 domain-containing protein [Propionibacteriaceae bacterium G1746]|uniref:DUF2798 domain-containing protein n=1 Tax=Aestuariimicrobium sp. G57 TaxID=3418485 RepID=UPI003C200E96
MNKRILLTQVIMTLLMASIMSGIMSLIAMGPSMHWLASWPLSALMAWPIAFAVTMVAWPASMAIAGAVLRPRVAAANAAAPVVEEA